MSGDPSDSKALHQDGAYPAEEPVVLYYDELVAFVRRMIGANPGVDDIIQETCLRYIGQQLRPGPEIENPRAFLYRIAGNLTRDRLRRKRTHDAVFSPVEDTDFVADPNPGPERILAARQRLAVLDRAIDELPARCREVFLLRRYGDMAPGEIAERLGISRNMVEKHLRAAMLHFTKRLNGDD